MNWACCPTFRQTCFPGSQAQKVWFILFGGTNKASAHCVCRMRPCCASCWLNGLLITCNGLIGLMLGGEMRSPFVVCAGSGGDNGGSRSSRVSSHLCFSSGLEWAPQRRRAWMSLSRTWSSCLLLSSTLIWLKSNFIKAGEGETHSAQISGMVLQTWPAGGSPELDLTCFPVCRHGWEDYRSRTLCAPFVSVD